MNLDHLTGISNNLLSEDKLKISTIINQSQQILLCLDKGQAKITIPTRYNWPVNFFPWLVWNQDKRDMGLQSKMGTAEDKLEVGVGGGTNASIR